MHRAQIDPRVHQTFGSDLMAKHNNAVVFSTGSFDVRTLGIPALKFQGET